MSHRYTFLTAPCPGIEASGARDGCLGTESHAELGGASQPPGRAPWLRSSAGSSSLTPSVCGRKPDICHPGGRDEGKPKFDGRLKIHSNTPFPYHPTCPACPERCSGLVSKNSSFAFSWKTAV